ncbi:3-phosphoshikimate 1-carboxyvinyltransferase [Candidatus Omnitrophota bacterium]
MPTIPSPPKLNATITIPGDKSISHRAIMLASLAKGTTTIINFLHSDDTLATLEAFRRLGVGITYDKKKGIVRVRGKGRRLRSGKKVLLMKESGTTIRVIAGVLVGQGFTTVLEGAPSLQRRPMGRICAPLRAMGADISGREKGANEYPPLTIRPVKSLRGLTYTLPVASAQVKSCLLLAGLSARGKTVVTEPYQSRDHTERMLKLFKAALRTKARTTTIKSSSLVSPGEIFIPSDFSSAAYFIALGLLSKGSELVLKKVSINPTRLGLLTVVKRMGAKVSLKDIRRNHFEPYADIVVKASRLRATVIRPAEVPLMIDEIPLLFVLASFAKGVSTFYGLKELRVKEADRIRSMEYNLKRMGVAFEVNTYTDARGKEDVMVKIMGASRLKNGLTIKTFGDHRTAMSCSTANFCLGSAARLDETRCIPKSFPEYVRILDTLR